MRFGPHSEESKAKMRAAALRGFSNGRKHSWSGKSLPKEWRDKISKSNIGKKGSSGHAGKSHSIETKQRLREAGLGVKWSKKRKEKMSATLKKQYADGVRKSKLPVQPWNKGIRFEAVSGEKHHNWKGGITSAQMKVRMSIEMKNWRRAVFMRDNFTCQLCNVRGTTLHADHIKTFAEFPELRFELNNGRTLCVSCHRKTPTYGGRQQKNARQVA